MLTFKQIEALYWTVRLGTFAASAQKLHTTQSAITKRIQELEADFDIALFDRSGYRAELTARGHEIYALAEEMLGHRDRLLVRLKGQHTLTGTFRFGITEITAMTWLPALIRLLRSHYPRITLEPHIDLGADLLKRLQAGQLDMAFLHGEFAEPGLEVAPLQRLEFAWMGSPDMIDASRVYTPADIAALPLLRQSQESGLNMIYDGWLKPHTPAHNLFTINSLIAMAGLTAAGFGVSCLPRDYFADMVNTRQLVIARTSVARHNPSTAPCTDATRTRRSARTWPNWRKAAATLVREAPKRYALPRACLRTGGADPWHPSRVAPVSCEVAWHAESAAGDWKGRQRRAGLRATAPAESRRAPGATAPAASAGCRPRCGSPAAAGTRLRRTGRWCP